MIRVKHAEIRYGLLESITCLFHQEEVPPERALSRVFVALGLLNQISIISKHILRLGKVMQINLHLALPH